MYTFSMAWLQTYKKSVLLTKKRYAMPVESIYLSEASEQTGTSPSTNLVLPYHRAQGSRHSLEIQRKPMPAFLVEIQIKSLRRLLPWAWEQ